MFFNRRHRLDAKKRTVCYGSWCYCSLHTLICVGLSIMSLEWLVKI